MNLTSLLTAAICSGLSSLSAIAKRYTNKGSLFGGSTLYFNGSQDSSQAIGAKEERKEALEVELARVNQRGETVRQTFLASMKRLVGVKHSSHSSPRRIPPEPPVAGHYLLERRGRRKGAP